MWVFYGTNLEPVMGIQHARKAKRNANKKRIRHRRNKLRGVKKNKR
jgi:hypothetical protein